MNEFKHLGVLFTSEGRMEGEIDRWICGIKQALYRTVVVNKELSWQAKLNLPVTLHSKLHLWACVLDCS